MNREIKFRFWGNFGELNEEEDICEMEMLYGDKFSFFESEPINNLFASKNFQVMQYTGLKDKNGKEIYEGDIDDRKRVCEYFPNLGCFGFKSPKHSAITFLGQFITGKNIIIGNIYEHPELLENKTTS